MKTGAALPPLTIAKLEDEDLNVTQVSWPMAWTLAMIESSDKEAKMLDFRTCILGGELIKSTRLTSSRMLGRNLCRIGGKQVSERSFLPGAKDSKRLGATEGEHQPRDRDSRVGALLGSAQP